MYKSYVFNYQDCENLINNLRTEKSKFTLKLE